MHLGDAVIAEDCNDDIPCPEWKIKLSACSATCDGGKMGYLLKSSFVAKGFKIGLIATYKLKSFLSYFVNIGLRCCELRTTFLRSNFHESNSWYDLNVHEELFKSCRNSQLFLPV